MDNNLPQHLDQTPEKPTFPLDNLGRKIFLFGLDTCPDCQRIKKYFSENSIQYEYLDVAKDRIAAKWLATFTHFVPVLIMLDGSILYEPSNDELTAKLDASFGGQSAIKTPQPQIFDTIIIGAGAAGITAAIYAVRRNLQVLVIAKSVGGQAAMSGDIENYPGFSMISGIDLAAKFKADLERFQGLGLWIKEGQEVTKMEKLADGLVSVTAGKNVYKAQTAIIASGRTPRMLNVPGEAEFFGKGVATCATCDAPLYKGKAVAIVGGGNSALDATLALMKGAASAVIINNTDNLRGDSMMLKNVEADNRIKVINNATVRAIKGEFLVEKIEIEHTADKTLESIPVDGIFIEIGWIPSADFVPETITKNDHGEIMVDEFGKTSVEGIWAAGDVNNLWGEQIVIAAGEGAKTALSVSEYLAKTNYATTSNVHMDG